jgi:hypothetical protein
MPEAITGIEMISIMMCTWTHVSGYPDIHWAYSMNAEYFLLRQYVRVEICNSKVESNLQLVTSRKHC